MEHHLQTAQAMCRLCTGGVPQPWDAVGENDLRGREWRGRKSLPPVNSTCSPIVSRKSENCDLLFSLSMSKRRATCRSQGSTQRHGNRCLVTKKFVKNHEMLLSEGTWTEDFLSGGRSRVVHLESIMVLLKKLVHWTTSRPCSAPVKRNFT